MVVDGEILQCEESRILEYKEFRVLNLERFKVQVGKYVVGFLNSEGCGRIIFGVTDEG